MARAVKPRRPQPPWRATLSASIPVRLALLALLATLAHGAALSSGVAWDDAEQVSGNPAIRTLAAPWRFFADPWTLAPRGGDFLAQYRPLRTLAYALQFAVFGGSAWGFHLVSLLLHAAGAWAVGLLTRTLFGRGHWLAAAIWLLHPVLAENVLYLSAQGNLLCLLGAVLAVACHLRWLEGGSPVSRLTSITAAAVAAFAYEFGVLVPALVAIAELAWRRTGRALRGGVVVRYLPLLAVVALYLGARAAFGGALPAPAWWGGSRLASVAIELRLWVVAWGATLLPLGLLPRYMPDDAPAWLTAGVALGAHLLVVAGAIVVWRRRPTSVFPLALLWWYVAQAPTANVLVPNLGFPFALRFLFIALVLPVAAFAAWCARRAAGRTAWWLVAIAVLAVWIPEDQRLVRVWRSTRSLFAELAERRPHDPLGHIGLAAAHFQVGDLAGAEASARVALRLAPQDTKPHFLLAEVRRAKGNTAEAATLYRETLRRNRVHIPARLAVARQEIDAGNDTYALDGLRGVLEVGGVSPPSRARGLALRARAEAHLGDCRAAVASTRAAVATWPHASDVLFDAGRTLAGCGLAAEAHEAMRAAAEAAWTDYAAMVGDTSAG
jgi:tetratricopeptide (TPR) repeat protein